MTTATMAERDVEKIAWTVLVCAFAAFMVLLVGVPSLGYLYVTTATDPHESTVTVLGGTVIIELPGRDPAGEQRERSVPEGATIRTDANTRVNLTLFDGSTVVVFPNTQVTLNNIRSAKFAMSQQPWQAWLDLRRGQLRLNVAQDGHARDFRVQTPHGESAFEQGDYLIEVTSDQTEVSARAGHAAVRARDGIVLLNGRERSLVKNGEPPRGPLPAQRDLIANGTFVSSLQDGWRVYNDQGGDGGSVDGAAELLNDQGRMAVRFTRRGSNGNHDDTGIEQIINKDVTDAEVLRLRAEVRVNFQSLSGGGYLSSEFPLMIRVKYRDIKGGENFWVRGFYYQNESKNPTVNGEQVPQGLWYPFVSDDLT
ncbi:MAG: FecR family protein, partial [Chloroflexi bacterium]|nr:FecR family protein [Chloroflexota bacterium]